MTYGYTIPSKWVQHMYVQFHSRSTVRRLIAVHDIAQRTLAYSSKRQNSSGTLKRTDQSVAS